MATPAAPRIVLWPFQTLMRPLFADGSTAYLAAIPGALLDFWHANAEGQYAIVDVRPGVYSVTFTLSGFNAVRRDGIELPAGTHRVTFRFAPFLPANLRNALNAALGRSAAEPLAAFFGGQR